MSTGERIKKARKEQGLTLSQLADASECSKSYIWELESRNPPRPSADKLSSIAAVLGLTVDYLLGADNHKNAQDEAFYRSYLGLAGYQKKQMRQLLKVIDV